MTTRSVRYIRQARRVIRRSHHATYGVAVMAKAPIPGRVKTRLVPPLSNSEAADLYRCLLLDKILQVGQLHGVDLYVAYTPAAAGTLMREVVPRAITLVRQIGADLGDRLYRLSASLLERGHLGVVLLDSDTPTLPTLYLVEAIARLQEEATDLVLGPAEDGGYYLIGLKRPCPALFAGIPWSSSTVLAETIRRASASRLVVATLPIWYDVDTPEDLDRLREELVRSETLIAPHTQSYLFEGKGMSGG